MPRKKATQEKPKTMQVVSRLELEDYLLEKPFLDKEQYKKSKDELGLPSRYGVYCAYYFAHMYLHFFKHRPGHVVRRKDFVDAVQELQSQKIKINLYRSATSKAKEVLKIQFESTLYNVRGEGYCLATPAQLEHEVLKSFYRSFVYCLSGVRLRNLKDYEKTDPKSRARKMVEGFRPVYSAMQNMLGSLSEDEKEKLYDVLKSQILTPDFVHDESYLEKGEEFKPYLKKLEEHRTTS